MSDGSFKNDIKMPLKILSYHELHDLQADNFRRDKVVEGSHVTQTEFFSDSLKVLGISKVTLFNTRSFHIHR